MDYNHQHILITGGGSGLGAATAQNFASKGAKVSLIDLQIDKANALANDIGEGQAQAFELDVTQGEEAAKTLDKAIENFGPLRGLINCAGIAPGERLVGREGAHDLGRFEKAISVNLIGSFNMMRLAAERMINLEPVNDDGERGVIINTASVAAYEGQIGQVAYSASKGGVVGMTLPAARELSKFGVRVVTIAPGLMETPMLAGMPEHVYDSLIASTLFPKRLGTGLDYAKLAASIFDNPLINGETIRLDGAIRLAPK